MTKLCIIIITMGSEDFVSDLEFRKLREAKIKKSLILFYHYVSPTSNKYMYKETFVKRVFSRPSMLLPVKRWFFLSSQGAKDKLDLTLSSIFSNLR